MEPRHHDQVHHVALRVAALASVMAGIAFGCCVDHLGHFGLGGRSIAAQAARYHNAFSPAGYALSIWAFIYGAFLVYAVVELRARWRSSSRLDLASAMLIVVNLLAVSWIAVFRHDRIALSMIIIACMLLVGIAMYVSLYRLVAAGASRLFLLPASLFLAWITVATVADAGVLCVAHGVHGGAIGETPWAIAALVALTLIGCVLALRLGDYVFPLVVAWAAIAIGVEAGEPGTLAVAAFVSAGVGTVIAAAVATSLFGPPPSRLDGRPSMSSV